MKLLAHVPLASVTPFSEWISEQPTVQFVELYYRAENRNLYTSQTVQGLITSYGNEETDVLPFHQAGLAGQGQIGKEKQSNQRTRACSKFQGPSRAAFRYP